MHTRNMILKFIRDSGHGWLQVPMPEYRLSKVMASSCSYFDRGRNNVYLEEDCDAPKFIEAMKSRDIDVVIEDIDLEGSCYVRRLPPMPQEVVRSHDYSR